MDSNSTEFSAYHPVVLNSIPRILTNLDRDPDSTTYGCFDRNYWHYKVQDYSSALLQQSALTLALIFKHDFTGNIYFNKELIREYALAGIDFCKKIQNSDGSFDEYWKREHSIPSTAFTLYALCECCDILDYQDDNLDKSIKKSVIFLEKHIETGALNQEMASIVAIRYAAKILGDNNLIQISENRFKLFLACQTDEGWFPEYGGLDISYSTVTLDYLIRYYELSKNPDAMNAAKKLLSLLKFFIHPDGSLGGEYGSRNTEYFLPYGIEYLKKECDIANSMIIKLMNYINQPIYLNSYWDERYLLHYICHSFVKALLIHKEMENVPRLPYEKKITQFFTDSQIYIKSNDDYYFICNLAKSGMFKVIDKKTLGVSTDCAFRLKNKKNLWVVEWPGHTKFSQSENEIYLMSEFTRKKIVQPAGVNLILVRLGSFILGVKMRDIVKKMLLFNEKRMKNMIFHRKIVLMDKKISIDDSIDIGNRTMEGTYCAEFSIKYIPSSKFFQINSLQNKNKNFGIMVDKKLDLHRELDFK